MKRAIALGTAAAAMIAAPLAAADRASAPVEAESEMIGGSLLLAALGVPAAIVAVVLIADGDDDDAVSP